MNIFDTLTRAITLYPDHIAVIDGKRRFTYAEVGARIKTLANYLQAQGLKSGDRISILDLNSLAFYETYYAAAGMGAVLNPLNVRLSPRELAFILQDAGSHWLIASPQFDALVQETIAEGRGVRGVLWTDQRYEDLLAQFRSDFEPESVQGENLAHLYYTSGTTGRAKGVMLTHNNVCIHALGAIGELHITDRDVWAHVAPMFHLADAWATFAITLAGGTHVMVPHFDAQTVMTLFQEERITITNLVPTMLNQMVKHPHAADHDYSSLRMLLSGGAPISVPVVSEILRIFGCEYVQTYGMTETSPYLTLSLLKSEQRSLSPEEQLRYKAMTGRPFITVDLKVVNEKGVPVIADGQHVGEILVRGDTVTPGYWNRDEETQAAFVGDWLRTGDLAVMDAAGYINIVDRKKDMILSGGENIYSVEVENVLYHHPRILEAAVFGVPDELFGEVVKAAVVIKPGEQTSEEEIIDFCKENLAAYKAPKSIDFLEHLPRTGSGKIHKKVLRDKYWSK